MPCVCKNEDLKINNRSNLFDSLVLFCGLRNTHFMFLFKIKGNGCVIEQRNHTEKKEILLLYISHHAKLLLDDSCVTPKKPNCLNFETIKSAFQK